MDTQAVINYVKEAYKRFISHWSHHHLEALCILVAGRPNGCLVLHRSRKQMDSEMHIMMESQKSLDLFSIQKKKRIKRIFIEGAPGVGKTILSRFLIEEWMNGNVFQKFKLVLFFPLCQIKFYSRASATSNFESLNEALTQILSEESLCTSLFHYLKKNDGNGVLIVADGWDELSENERRPGTLPYELLFGGLLSHASVIVTSRPLATGIPSEAIDEFIKIHGFDKETIQKFVRFEFSDDPQKGH